MKIEIEYDESVGTIYVPEFWWTNIITRATNADKWVDEEELNDDDEYIDLDLDYDLETQMEKYEIIRDERREDGYCE